MKDMRRTWLTSNCLRNANPKEEGDCVNDDKIGEDLETPLLCNPRSYPPFRRPKKSLCTRTHRSIFCFLSLHHQASPDIKRAPARPARVPDNPSIQSNGISHSSMVSCRKGKEKGKKEKPQVQVYFDILPQNFHILPPSTISLPMTSTSPVSLVRLRSSTHRNSGGRPSDPLASVSMRSLT